MGTEAGWSHPYWEHPGPNQQRMYMSMHINILYIFNTDSNYYIVVGAKHAFLDHMNHRFIPRIMRIMPFTGFIIWP